VDLAVPIFAMHSNIVYIDNVIEKVLSTSMNAEIIKETMSETSNTECKTKLAKVIAMTVCKSGQKLTWQCVVCDPRALTIIIPV